MTSKQIKYFQALLEFAKTDYLSNAESYLDFLRYSVEQDFVSGAQFWEYMFVIYESEITSESFALAFSEQSFEMLQGRSEQRAIKTLVDSPVLSRALYQYSPNGLNEYTTKLLVDFVLGNKLSAADEGFKGLAKNIYKAHGGQMKMVIERLFIEVLKRVGGGKAALTKKQNTLLLSHISKIKGAEKALLIQRLKELS